MKVLLYSENLKQIAKSGLGKSIEHQKKALTLQGIDYTTDPNEAFDLMHINTYFLKSVYLARKLRKNNIPVVFHAHSTAEDFRNSFKLSNQITPLFKKWIQFAYKQSDLIITPTPYSKYLLDKYGLNREIVSMSNGIDLKRFAPIEQARDKFNQAYNYQNEDFIVMGIGLYLERKGILDFIELAHRLPHIQFIWFGYIDLNLVPEKIRQAIKNKPANLNLAGYVPNDDIILGLQATDLYVFPTWEETEGIPAVEACASRAKFIVRDIPVFQDWLIDGYNVHKAKDINEFEELIQETYQGNLEDLTDQAFEVAKERDLSIIGQHLHKAYQKAIENHKNFNA